MSTKKELLDLNLLKVQKNKLLYQNQENRSKLKVEEKSKERLITGLKRKERIYKKQIDEKQKISKIYS